MSFDKSLNLTAFVVNLVANHSIAKQASPKKKIGGRILYDAAEIDEAVKEKTIFRYKRRKNDRF